MKRSRRITVRKSRRRSGSLRKSRVRKTVRKSRRSSRRLRTRGMFGDYMNKMKGAASSFGQKVSSGVSSFVDRTKQAYGNTSFAQQRDIESRINSAKKDIENHQQYVQRMQKELEMKQELIRNTSLQVYQLEQEIQKKKTLMHDLAIQRTQIEEELSMSQPKLNELQKIYNTRVQELQAFKLQQANQQVQSQYMMIPQV